MGKKIKITTSKATIIVVNFPVQRGSAMAAAILCNPNFGEKDFRGSTPLGPVSQISEEIWRGIVDDPFIKGVGQYNAPDDTKDYIVRETSMGKCWEKLTHISFKDYNLSDEDVSIQKGFPFKTATESGLSLLKANGVVLECKGTPLLLSSWMDSHQKVWSNPHIFLTP